MRMLIQVSLTPAEQKLLVNKGVANMDVVKKDYKEKIIIFPLCTTNGYVVEELTGRKIPQGYYACGIIIPQGTCFTDPEHQSAKIVIEKGKFRELKFPKENLHSYMEKMDSDDVIIKSGNTLDSKGECSSFCRSIMEEK
jgi:hypothetical protein